MNFLQQYLAYNAGNECPQNYHVGAAFSLLSATLFRKVYIDQGYFTIYPNLYICLVGEQGNGKSTAKDIARDIYMNVFPNNVVSASVMSKEAITKFLGSSESLRAYTDEKGESVEFHPLVLFINELKSFLSINPAGMIDFLTDVYDRKHFSVVTKNKGVDIIPNPCLIMLACETPDWIIERLKEKVISGGFSRRVIYVYETEDSKRIPFPVITEEARAALRFVQDHLKKLENVVGPFQWEPSARKFFDAWYRERKAPTDTALRGYYRTKHVQLLKVAMLVALCEEPFNLLLKEEHLQVTLKLFERIETHLPELFLGVGRNELAYPTQKVLEYIKANNGSVLESDLYRFAHRDMSPVEAVGVVEHLKRTEQIESARILDAKAGFERRVIMLKEVAVNMRRLQEKAKT